MQLQFWRKKTLFLFYTHSSFSNFIKMKERFSAFTLTWIKNHIRMTKHEKGPVEIITLATRVESIVWTKLTVTARRRITLQIEKGTMSATSNPVCSKNTPGADYRPCLTNNPRWRNLILPWFRFFRSKSPNTSKRTAQDQNTETNRSGSNSIRLNSFARRRSCSSWGSVSTENDTI